MKKLALLCLFVGSVAWADAKKEPAKDKETPAEKTGRAFLTKVVESPDALAISKAGIQYFMSIRDGVKGCETMTNGTANTAPLAAKLKACIAAAYKQIGQGGAVAKAGLGETEMDKFIGHFGKAEQKKMKDLTAGTKILESNFAGDGESLTIFLSVHPTNGVIAVWLEAEAVE